MTMINNDQFSSTIEIIDMLGHVLLLLKITTAISNIITIIITIIMNHYYYNYKP